MAESSQLSSLAERLCIATPSPLEPLVTPATERAGVHCFVKRDDRLHPIISGNKWRKLSVALAEIIRHNHTQIISFGGGHSNHLHALGWCCQKLGLKFHAMVRGDYRGRLTPTLVDLHQWEASITYLDRDTYRRRDHKDYLAELGQLYPEAVIIPEGGSQAQALAGVADIGQELAAQHAGGFDVAICPVGSGGTLAGLSRCANFTSLLGIAVLKGEGYLEGLVIQLANDKSSVPWQINHDWHFGGYAKTPDELRQFCEAFTAAHGIPLEPVYSGKMFYAAMTLIEQGYFARGSRILLLHTGGLQGARVTASGSTAC